MPDFASTYVLLCSDGTLYIGSSIDLRRRLKEHQIANAPSTANRLPVQLVYYEACL